MKRSLVTGLLSGVASAVIGSPAHAVDTTPANDPQRDNDIVVTGARVAQAGISKALRRPACRCRCAKRRSR